MRTLMARPMSPSRSSVGPVIDYISSMAGESKLFLAAINSITEAGTTLDAVAVPTCPDWTAADLTWHLTEVQYFWAAVVKDKLETYTDATPLDRPADDALPGLFLEQSERMVSVLAEGEDADPCWSWHPAGGSRGWVRRRQAQEALIHRVDAELTAAQVTAAPLSPVDEDLAADGIDEMLRVMLGTDPLPEWASFEPGPDSVRITVPQQTWDVVLGHVVGTNDDGPQHLPALRVEDGPLAAPGATVTAPASEVDLWLWRRGSLADGAFRGNRAVADSLRTLAEVQ